jgi:hypothetical protein
MLIPDADLDFLPIPYPEVKKGTGYWIRVRNTGAGINKRIYEEM